MKSLLLFLACLLSATTNAQVKIDNLCNSSVSIRIASKDKLKCYKQDKDLSKEQHSLYPSICTYRIQNSKKASLSIQVVDEQYDEQNSVLVDSCFLKRSVSKYPAELCLYRIRSHQFMIADIQLRDKKVRIIFNKKDYDFAMKIMDKMVVSE